jgi:hypothetical protein
MITKIKNKISATLLKNKIKKQFKLLFFNYKIEKAKNKTIVIFAGIGDMYISPFEILMYHLLNKKGFKVKYLIYDNNIPANELITKAIKEEVGREIFWNKSVKNSLELLNSSNVDYDFITYDEDVFTSIKKDIPKTLNGLLTFKYEGINFGEIVKGCLYRYYKSLTFGTDVYLVALDNLKVCLSNYISIRTINTSNKIDLVLMSHGIYTTWEPIVEFCKINKTNYICYDRGKTKDHINININQNSPNWDFSKAWTRYLNKSLSNCENLKVDNYLKERELQKGDVYSYNFSEKEKNIDLLKNRLKIPLNKKIVTIFTNLIWDAANVSRDIAFKNPLECIIKTIEYYQGNDSVQIVVRSHPAEKVLGTKERYADLISDYFNNKLPDNVTIIEPEDNVNSFSVIEMSDVGVVNTSTVGLEFAIEGKPILLISETNYRDKGFTFDIDNESVYFETLNNQLNETTLKENQVLLARKYFFIMMFLYQKKIPVNYNKGVFLGYEYDSLDRINNDSSIQNILNTIEKIDTESDFVKWPQN